MQIIIFKKKVFYFSICFIFITIFGTLSHELGHIIVAKNLGYETILHYSSMEWNNDVKEGIIKFYLKNESIIEKKQSFQNSVLYYKKLDKIYYDEFLIILGGILQTIITGSISFFLLIFYKRKELGKISFWSLIFISLFWSRQVFNLLKGILLFVFNKSDSFFWGDEQKLSIYLKLYNGTFSILLGILGCLILSIIFFKIIPYAYRFSFILSSLIGSFLGYMIWMVLLGPLILP